MALRLGRACALHPQSAKDYITYIATNLFVNCDIYFGEEIQAHSRYQTNRKIYIILSILFCFSQFLGQVLILMFLTFSFSNTGFEVLFEQ